MPGPRPRLAVGHGDERGAHGDFGLAEADVAAHQPIHRLYALQVFECGVDRGSLILRLLEREGLGERLVVVLLQLESVSYA